MSNGIVGTSFWQVIGKYIKMEPYEREGGGVWNPRERIELWPMPADVRRQALAHVQPCVACGAPIHPFREREGSGGHLYYAATCPWSQNLRCSRGRAAREEYRRVSDAVADLPKGDQGQGSLFP